jgi:hypothetical protein
MTGIKNKSGGFRDGSGRPKKEETVVLSFRVPKKKAKGLRAAIIKVIDHKACPGATAVGP